MTSTRPANFFLHVFNDLDHYVNHHFKDEEKLFTKSEYPDVSYHKSRHALFRDEVNNLKSDFKNNIINIKFVLKFFALWFIEHVNGIDRDYVPYITQNK